MNLIGKTIQDIRFKGFKIKNRLTYFFFQRVLLINLGVPWPVHWTSVVWSPWKIKRKSSKVWPGYSPGQYIQARNGIQIGKNVLIGPGVKIISANHDICDFDVQVKSDPIVIGDNCWLGSNCVVLPGTKLGNHVIVGAGAVVNKCFPDDCVIGGVPAKVLKKIGHYEGKTSC